MAGSLIRLQDIEISSSVSSIDVGGSEWDSSYNVYKLRIENLKGNTDNFYVQFRVLTDGVAQTDSSYYYGGLQINSTGGFTTFSQSAVNYAWGDIFVGNASGENFNADYHLFSFNNSLSYSYFTDENTSSGFPDYVTGYTGGGLKKTFEANNGIQIFTNTGTIESAKITLFGLRK